MFATMTTRLSLTTPRFIQTPRRGSAARRSFLATRAAAEEGTAAATTTTTSEPKALAATYFYAGRAYTEEEWRRAKATGVFPVAEDAEPSTSDAEVLGLGELMAFSGALPELVNGRLAMLAFISAVGAELASGDSVLRQFAEEPTGVVLTAITFFAASIIAFMNQGTTQRDAWGPFTPAAEMLNGRAAMLGFASLLVAEAIRGGAFFS